MIGEYKGIFANLAALSKPLGFLPTSDEDFFAKLRRADGWEIWLDGDKVAYPAFTLSIAHSGTSYALWMLMRLFEAQLPAGRATPSIENQLWFLKVYAETLFENEATYRTRYAEADR